MSLRAVLENWELPGFVVRMTHRQRASWLKTKEGLRFWCQLNHYDDELCGRELVKLLELEAVERDAIWEQKLEAGRRKARNTIFTHEPDAADDKEYVEQTAVMYAERSMLNDHIAPPHWTGVTKCLKCGEMPAYPDCTGLEVLACPWCFVGEQVNEDAIPF